MKAYRGSRRVFHYVLYFVTKRIRIVRFTLVMLDFEI